MAEQYNGLAARIAAALSAAGVPGVSGGASGLPVPMSIASSTASAGPAPSVFTVSVNPFTGNANHLLAIGDLVFVYLHRGNVNLNGGPYVVASAGFTATTFSLTDLYGNALYQNVGGNSGNVVNLNFGVTYQIPNDLDPSSALAWNVAFQALGDRTSILAASTGQYRLASFNTWHADGGILATPPMKDPGLAPAGGGGDWFPFTTTALSYLGGGIAAISNNGGLIEVTSNFSYPWVNGERVFINGCTTAVEANGYWIISAIDSTHFTLNNSTYVHSDSTGVISIPVALGNPGGALTAHIDDVSDIVEVDVSCTIVAPGDNNTDYLGIGLGYAAYGPSAQPSAGEWIQYMHGTTQILPLPMKSTFYVSSTTPSFTGENFYTNPNIIVNVKGILKASDIGVANVNELDVYLMGFNSTGSGNYSGALSTLGGITASLKVWRRTLFNHG